MNSSYKPDTNPRLCFISDVLINETDGCTAIVVSGAASIVLILLIQLQYKLLNTLVSVTEKPLYNKHISL